MYYRLDEVVNMIAGGDSARDLMLKHRVPPSKLRRALDSVRLNDLLELEARVNSAQMRLAAARHLPGALDKLVELMNYGIQPEIQRKAAMAIIAAATGINLASPGVSVYPKPPEPPAPNPDGSPGKMKGAYYDDVPHDDDAEEDQDRSEMQSLGVPPEKWPVGDEEQDGKKADDPDGGHPPQEGDEAGGEDRPEVPPDVEWLATGEIPKSADIRLYDRFNRLYYRELARQGKYEQIVAEHGVDTLEEAMRLGGPGAAGAVPFNREPEGSAPAANEELRIPNSESMTNSECRMSNGSHNRPSQASAVEAPAATATAPADDSSIRQPQASAAPATGHGHANGSACPGVGMAMPPVRNRQESADFGRPVNTDAPQETVAAKVTKPARLDAPRARGGRAGKRRGAKARTKRGAAVSSESEDLAGQE